MVCRSYIHRVQGWVIQMREKLEGQMEDIQGSPVGTGLIELSDSVGRESLIGASSGNVVAPDRVLAPSGMNGLVALSWERLDEVNGCR